MNTLVNNNNIESKNRVINYDIEIVRDFDGTYYVNARNELHEHIKGLPEYLPYKELKKTVKEALGVTLPPLKSLTFEGNGRKQYANAYGLQGIEIHQEPLAFGLQDKVVLGSFGESRPYAIGCTVTGYRWDSEVGEFLYILQGEDGKEYADFARNIIPDNGNDPKESATLETTSEITEADGIEVGSFVKINTDGRTAIVTGIGLVSEGHGVVLYLDDFTNWCQDCREKNGYNIIKTSDEVTPLTEDDYKPKADIKDDYKKGDRVRHNQSGRVATIEAVRVTREMKVFGEYRKVYRLNFGESVPGPFGTELNGGEFIAEAITLYEASEITDPEGRKFQDFTTWNGKTVKAEDREKWTNFFAEGISNKVNFGGNGSTYKHNAGKIRVSIAYRNGSKKAEDMSYCVSWYEETDKGTKLRESENGVSIWQAARAMADFHLLADVVGFTSIDEILNPTEKPTLESASEITEQREQNDAGISSAESRRDKANGQITEAEGVKVGNITNVKL